MGEELGVARGELTLPFSPEYRPGYVPSADSCPGYVEKDFWNRMFAAYLQQYAMDTPNPPVVFRARTDGLVCPWMSGDVGALSIFTVLGSIDNETGNVDSASYFVFQSFQYIPLIFNDEADWVYLSTDSDMDDVADFVTEGRGLLAANYITPRIMPATARRIVGSENRIRKAWQTTGDAGSALNNSGAPIGQTVVPPPVTVLTQSTGQ